MEENDLEAPTICNECGTEEATHVHSVEDGDPIAICDQCCDRTCDYSTEAYWNGPKA